jgi:hypothetical protein
MDRHFFHGGPVGGASLSILAAAALLMMVAGHAVVAEEAGTLPTCTGCEGPSPGALHPAKPPAPGKPAKPSPAAGPSTNYDGSWSGVSSGACILTWRWTVQVRNGVVSGSSTSGHVSPAGIMSGHMTVFRTTYEFIGKISGSHITGTWKSPDKCTGTWTANKS